MVSFDLDFFPRVFPKDDDERYDLNNEVEGFLSSLIRNGNIIGEHVVLELPDRWQVRVLGWSPDALDETNFSEYARADLEKLRPLLTRDVEIRCISETEREQRWCSCEHPSGRLLFTTFLARLSSPLDCLECGRDVPIYHLPLLEAEKERAVLLSWQDDYQALDTLYMMSGVGERYAYRQLARPKSDFMKETRQLAAKLEAVTEVPTYSFLLHSYEKWGKRCPLCGRKWKWENSPRSLLAFKCDHCRLVSSEASDERTPLSKLHR